MKVRILAALGTLASLTAVTLPSHLGAQTAKDTVAASRIRSLNDSVRANIAGSQRWSDSVRANQTRSQLLLTRIDSILTAGLVLPVPPPTNARPIALFTATCAAGACSLSAVGSTDDHGIAAYRWTPNTAAYGPLTGIAIVRLNTTAADITYREVLQVTDSAGLTGTKALTVTVPATLAIPPPDTIPLPLPGPNGLTAPAELPRVYLDFPYRPATGKTITVAVGGNLQAALNSAARGDEVVLPAAATFTGNFTLPVKPGTAADGWVTLRTDLLTQLPAEGTRVTAANANLMPKLVTTNSAPALATQAGASGWRIVGVEVTVSASYTGPQYGLLLLGDGSSAQNTLASVPSDLVLDRVYVHGQAKTELSRCVSLNSARTQITDSYLDECHAKGQDSQAIHGFNGPGPYKIVNNTLKGAGENVMFGGADPWITGMLPRDIEFRRNYVYTPPSWKGPWLKKNLFELKAGQRMLIEGNVFDGSWTSGQTGWAFVMKAENQSGRCTWCTTSDIVIRYNLIRNAGAGIAISGREGSSKNAVGALASRFTVQHNVLELINVSPFSGDARFFQVLGGATDVDLTNNTATSTGSMNTFLWLETNNTATRLAFNRNAVGVAMYGLLASSRSEGAASLAAVAGGWQFGNNVLIGAARSNYPLTTTFAASLAAVPSGVGADRAVVNALTTSVIVP